MFLFMAHPHSSSGTHPAMNGNSMRLNGPIAEILGKLGYGNAAASVRGADYSVYAQWLGANGDGRKLFNQLGLDGAAPRSQHSFLEEPDDLSPFLCDGLDKLCKEGSEAIHSAAGLSPDNLWSLLLGYATNHWQGRGVPVNECRVRQRPGAWSGPSYD